jgi:ubiquinone biosynthesis protein COQ4|tara:strand:- start:37516 stop:38379 length:864 start_codon:yes stop_codon:yes gene_type:complete
MKARLDGEYGSNYFLLCLPLEPEASVMIQDLPFLAASRPPRRMRPLSALRHFRALMRDAEDTAQVFHMGECLPNRSMRRIAERFCASAEGRARMQSEPSLAAMLDDHERLLGHGPQSVAHAYVRFMRAEGLSAAGLVEASTLPGQATHADQFGWFNDRLRDTHDLAHVLTGYGRDPLGEQCVLGFTSSQCRDWTETIIAWAGTAEFALRLRSDAPFVGAVAEARRHGRAAQAIFAQDIRALLAEPLAAARARMGIADPQVYRRAHDRLRAAGIDPYRIGGPARPLAT